jgi:hypothetical protein
VEKKIALDQIGKLRRYNLWVILIIGLSEGTWIWANQRTWFFGDDFAFLTYRYFSALNGDWSKALMYPHNEHWVAVPSLLFITIERVVGLKNHLVFMAPVLIAHFVIVLSVGQILRRRCKSELTALCGIATIGFISPGAENLLWAFQIGFVGAIALGFIQLKLLDRGGQISFRDYAASLIGVVAVATQGTGLTAIAFVTLFMLVRKQFLRALLVSGVPVIAFLLWYTSYGDLIQSKRATFELMLDIPIYVLNGLSTSLDALIHIPGSTTIILGFCIFGLEKLKRFSEEYYLPLSLAVGAVVFYVLNGLSRIQFGVEQATASRYTYVGVVLITPIVFMLIESATINFAIHRLIMSITLFWIVLSGITGILKASYTFPQADQTRIQTILEFRDAVESGVVLNGGVPSPIFDPDLTFESITKLIQTDKFDR